MFWFLVSALCLHLGVGFSVEPLQREVRPRGEGPLHRQLRGRLHAALPEDGGDEERGKLHYHSFNMKSVHHHHVSHCALLFDLAATL